MRVRVSTATRTTMTAKAGVGGDGPEYTGALTVTGPDDYDLDRDGDDSACEW